jgi:hypothetical protein
MSPAITKFAPQAVVLVVALYWSWPALKASVPKTAIVAPSAESKPSAGAQDFAGAVLSPTFAPPLNRNPFLSPDFKPALTAGSAKPGEKSKDEKAAADVHNPGLVLNATCIMGPQRFAVINGRIYKEKEAIQQLGGETPSCFVTQILPHKVVVSYQGETLQLRYANVAARPVAGNDPRKPAE